VADGDDWRVTISPADPGRTADVRRSLPERGVERDVHRRLGRSVAVGGSDSQVFLYAGTELAAREAERVAREVLARHGIQAEFALHRWHPVEERWENAGVALPRTDAEREAEHQRLEQEETAESLAAGVAQWEARAELRSRHEAVTLERKLRDEGYPVVRRWRFLVAGANNSDDADRLAERIRQLAPPGATVRAEPSGAALPFIPF
jgi:hypothetical protein